MAKKAPFNHFEFRTRDRKRLSDFYGSLFNWKFAEQGPIYSMIDSGNEEITGGIFQITPETPDMPPGVSAYIAVKSLDETEAHIRELGGTVLKSKEEVAGMGHFSIFKDVDGNTMAIWQNLDKKERKAAAKAAKKAEKAAKKAKKADKVEKPEKASAANPEKQEKKQKKAK
jgi:uncharacterized protein